MSDLSTELNNINENFPVQGKDNPSQGFRENFSHIKYSFTIANNEIELLKDSISKTITVVNSDYNTGDTVVNIEVNDSEYQTVNLDSPIIGNTLTVFLSGFTDEVYCYTKLEVNNNTGNTITLLFNGNVKSPVDAAYVLDNQTYIIECWSTDNGNTIFVNPVNSFKVW